MKVKSKESDSSLGLTKGKFYDVVYEHSDKRTVSNKVYVLKNDNKKFVGIDPIHFE